MPDHKHDIEAELLRQFRNRSSTSAARAWPIARRYVSVGILRRFRSQQSPEFVKNAPDEREARIVFLHFTI
jgi:hypothetical protein